LAVSAATVIALPLQGSLEGMTTPDLESELLGLAGHIAAAEARFLQLLAEFDDRGGWAGDGIRSCYLIRWLAGRWEIRRPDGTPIPTVGAPLTGNTETLIEMHTRARLRIDRTTLTPDWYGDRLDPEPILDALLPRPVNPAA
jgi:hypothetical protein